MVRSAFCSHSELGLESQHPHGGPQLSITPVLGSSVLSASVVTRRACGALT